MPAPSSLHSQPRQRALLTAGVVAGALALGWLCIENNLERGCWLQDTPYLDLCGESSAGRHDAAALAARIQRNPGDSAAYLQLAMADRSPARARLLEGAARLAPNNRNILTAQATAALERQDWAAAVKPLVQLAEHRQSDPAALALAHLIAGGQASLLAPYLTPGSHWLARTLAQMSQLRLPFSPALPLVAQALKLDLLDAETVRNYLRQLKAAGAWADAYALWLGLHGKPLPTLYNGSFDDAFQADGFDWEFSRTTPASRAGAVAERRMAEERGAILDIRFTGRAMALPLARQTLFLGPGRYRLKGEYMASQLRLEHGLAWTASCPGAAAPVGQSAPLADTGGSWQAFSFEFLVPVSCGLVTRLQLETHTPAEAASGSRGRAAFDALSLERLAS